MKLRDLFSPRSIRFRLFAVILVLTLLPLMVMFFANRWSIQSRLNDQTRQTYYTALQQTGNYVRDRVAISKNLVNMLCGDISVQNNDFPTFGETSSGSAWLRDISSSHIIYKGSLLGSLSRVYYYPRDAVLPFREDTVYAALTDAERSACDQWFENDRETSMLLTFPSNPVNILNNYVYLLVKVPSAAVLGEYIGMIQANIPVNALNRILEEAPASENTSMYLVASDGRAFLSTGHQLLTSDQLEDIAVQLAEETDGLTNVRVNGRSYLAGQVNIPGTDWRLVMALPYSDLTSILNGAAQLLMLTFLLLVILTIPFTAVISNSLIKPVLWLQKGANDVAQGRRDVIVRRSGISELDETIDSFNDMSQRIKDMMDDQYRLGQSLKDKELQVLQEQINPHFLYNTLDLLHWKARSAGSKELESMIYAMSEFYKLSLGHGEEIVTLDHELRHVEAYMRIQEIRFMKRIRLEIDVEDAVRACRIIKMVLQPLVENSIQHGIREKADESGTIRVNAHREGDEVILQVSDDGVGMDEEKAAQLLSSDHPGYGVYNVNDRLVLNYGQSARLVYHSIPGEGTTVTVRLPFQIQ